MKLFLTITHFALLLTGLLFGAACLTYAMIDPKSMVGAAFLGIPVTCISIARLTELLEEITNNE